MTSNVTRTNNGKRLMAAIAVLALIACAFVAFAPTEDSNGLSTGTPVAGTELEGSNVTITTGTDFYINSEVTITSMTGTTVNIYLGENGSVTLPRTIATTTIQTGTFNEETGMITPYNGLSLSGATSGEYTAINGGIKTPSTVSSSTFGISVKASTSAPTTYYAEGSNIESTTLIAADSTVTVKNGSATINGAASSAPTAILNSISIENVVSTSGVIITGAADGTLTIAGEYTDGEITITKGKATVGTGYLKPSTGGASPNTTEGVLNAYASGDATSSTATLGATLTDLAITAGDLSTIPATPYIYGTVQTPTSSEIATITTYNFENATVSNVMMTESTGNTSASVDVTGFTGTLTYSNGFTFTMESGEIELRSGMFVTSSSDFDIPAESELSIGVNAQLTLGGDVTLDSNSVFNVYGSLLSDDEVEVSDNTSLTTDGVYGEFNSYGTARIGQHVMINVANANIASMNIFNVANDLDSDVRFSQTQRVVITDSMTVMSGVTVDILGELVINEGVTMTIQPGAVVNVGSANTSVSVVTIDGRLVIQSATTLVPTDGMFNVAGGESVDISGTVDVKGDLSVTAGELTIANGGRVAVDTMGSIAVSGGDFVVQSGAELSIRGIISGSTTTTIDNAGTVTVNNEKTVASTESNANAGDVIINLISDGAVADIDSIVLAQGKKLTVSDEGLVLYRTSGVETAVLAANANKIVVGGAYANAAGSTPAKNVKGVFSGVVFTADLTSTSSATGERSYTHVIDISGTASFEASTAPTTVGTIDMTITGASDTEASATAVGVDRGVVITDVFNCGEYVNVINTGKLDVSGEMYVTADDSSFVNNAGTITVTGQIKAVDEIAATINAAMYEATENGDDFVYYTTLGAALDVADEIYVLGTITVTETDEIPAGTTVIIDNGNYLVIGTQDNRDVTLTVTDSAVLENNGQVTVNGTLVVIDAEEGLEGNGPVISDVYTLDGNTARYTNIYTALNGLSSGTVTITKTVEDLVLNQDLVVPSGVTLVAPAGVSQIVLADGVTLTVDENATLEVWDSIRAETAFADEASAVNHTSAIVIDGTFKSTDENVYDLEEAQSYKTAGAYFSVRETAALFYYITPVEVAAPMSEDFENGEVDIYGENTVGDVTFTGTEELPVLIDIIGDVDASSIDLTWATLRSNAGSAFTGTVTSDSGAVTFTDAVGFTVRVVVSEETTYMYVSGTNVTDADTTNRTEFDMTVDSGNVYAQGTSNSPLAVDRMTVESGATFTVSGTTSTATAAEFGMITVNGTLDVVSNGSISATIMEVFGTANLGAATTTQAAGTSDIVMMFVGATAEDTLNTGLIASLGADGVVNGDFSADMVFAASGTTVDEKVTEGMDYTEYYINNALFMTVYSNVDAPIDIVAYPEIPGEKVISWQVDDDGIVRDVTDDDVIGSFDRTDAEIDTDVYIITIVAEYGITDIYVDGDLVNTEGLTSGSMTVPLAVGEHQITYRLNNYFAGDVKITLNGEALTDGKFTITSDMPFEDDDGTPTEYKIVLTGVEAAAPENPSSGDSGSSDGMGLTDYLLIVLVVLIVVMAIIVAIRLMRS